MSVSQRRAWPAILAGLAAAVALLAIAVPAASAAGECEGCAPWWHLTSGARPAILPVGESVMGEQEILTTPGEYQELEFTDLRLRVREDPYANESVGHGEFATEPGAAREGATVLDRDNLQKALEAQDEYGPGNVVVEEENLEAGAKRFVIKTVAKSPLEVFAEVGSAHVNVVTKGKDSGEIYLEASNLGDADADGETSPVVIKDQLPEGFTAVEYEAISGGAGRGKNGGNGGVVECELPAPNEQPGTVTCTYAKTLQQYGEVEVRIGVLTSEQAHTGELNSASVSGGGAHASVSVRRPLTMAKVPGEKTPFGIEDYEVTPETEDGVADTQAGSHPFQTTFTLQLNQGEAFEGFDGGEPEAEPAGSIKDFRAKLPPGLIGNPTPFARCTMPQFQAETCPVASVVGAATVVVNEPQVTGLKTILTHVYNLEPSPGEPARFGFLPTKETPVFIDSSVRSGEDYGINGETNDIVEVAGDLRAQVTLWGVPGDSRHDGARGAVLDEHDPPPFLALPTSCTGHPLESVAEADPWSEPGHFVKVSTNGFHVMPTLQGCNRLPFEPSITATPDVSQASTATGLSVDVHVPQEAELNATSLAQSSVKDITVALPEGVAINPASGDGLQACSEGLAGFFGLREFDPGTEPGVYSQAFTPALPDPLEPGSNFCPDASKVGTAEIVTPLLPADQHLKGSVYLASQNENPFGSLIAMYIVVEDPISGVVVKLSGQVHLSETGQIVTTFTDSPQAPFEDAILHFFGGERAPLATPARCGAYTTTASFVPWSAEPGQEEALTVHASSTFDITTGPGGSPCPGASLPFSPSLTSGTTNINAGSFSALSTTINREDGQQNLQSVTLHYPPGVSGMLKGVALCPEAQANEGTCGPESLIGETIVSAGVGPDPVAVKGGKVYLTEKYAGAPFGLSIVNPVKAGPFDLEHDTSNPAQDPPCDCVVVRAKVEVNPLTAALTVTTDPSGPHAIPHLIDGIPVQIKAVNVLVNRPGFTFNPTNCDPTAVTGSVTSDEGATQLVQEHFQVTNCAALKFAPSISFSTSGKTSKQDGADLITKLTYPSAPQGTLANIGYVKVELPKALPSRLTTLQKACTDAQFEANPAGCPAESKIGYATVHTPLLPVPLTGPAIFVSHGGEAFPSLTMVLQGYGVTVDLVGTTFISKTSVTSTTFKTVPDVPFSTFELVLPQGPYSALATNLPHESHDLCGQKLVIPNEFLSQAGGAPVKQDSTIAVTGCAPAIKVVSHKVNGRAATIQVSVPAAGKLVATAKGFSKASKTAKGATTATLKLTLTNAEAAVLSKHKGRKLKAKISLTFTPNKGGKLKAATTVLIG
jgi:hypothetical protein